MKIYIAAHEPGRIGGGWTFTDNFVKGMGDYLVSSYNEADIYFIPSPSMVQRDEVQQAKTDGKKIVLRIDNAIRNSRNRNTGMTRMKDFCEMADLVIYQSNWAREFLYPFTKTDGAVILNGVDRERFKPFITPREDTYLYVRSSRDDGKQWIMAWYWFVNNPGYLTIVGKFSGENLQYNFDFYNQERYQFIGEQKDMASIYRSSKYFLYTYLNDACSNTLIEALESGCEIVDVYGMLDTGGAPEILNCTDLSLERMAGEYKKALESIL